MYITDENNVLKVSDNSCGAILKINNPKYYISDKIYEVNDEIICKGNTAEYSNTMFSVKIDVSKESGNLFKVVRKWKNKGNEKIELQTIFEIKELFGAERYLIPCVNFNGNEFGNGNEPKGLECEGKPWIFSYDRMSIPACSVTENDRYAIALFASLTDAESMRSASSIVHNDEGYTQCIIHPEKDAPYTYTSKDLYGSEYNRYAELLPGQEIVTEMYIYAGTPYWKNFGVAGLLDEVLDMTEDVYDNKLDYKKIWNYSISFAKSLITDCKGKKGFIIGYLPDEKGCFKYREDEHFQLAWCGQNAMFCRMLIADYVKYGNNESLETAIEIMDNWIDNCVADSGLMAVQLQDYPKLNEASADVCNLGYGAYEILKIYEALKKNGIEKKSYFNAAKGICDFFADNYSDEIGFGKEWSIKGECVAEGGTIGAFIILPMCKLFEITQDKKYLETAKKAMELYSARDLDKFVCTAGALDTCCVDKETSAPLIFSAIMLYEITKEQKYLETAKKAAYYFASWMYHYTPFYDENSDIAKMGIHITGYTAVSAQHHHVDAYAALVVPYFKKLAQYTGDEKWDKRADMMFGAVMQSISDGNDVIHGRKRPIGAQNEGIFHCRWWHGDDMGYTADSAKGNFDDWLVAWVCAFRLNCILEIFE